MLWEFRFVSMFKLFLKNYCLDCSRPVFIQKPSSVGTSEKAGSAFSKFRCEVSSVVVQISRMFTYVFYRNRFSGILIIGLTPSISLSKTCNMESVQKRSHSAFQTFHTLQTCFFWTYLYFEFFYLILSQWFFSMVTGWIAAVWCSFKFCSIMSLWRSRMYCLIPSCEIFLHIV